MTLTDADRQRIAKTLARHAASSHSPGERAEWIAAAHRDVPWLIGLVEDLAAENDKMRDQLDYLNEVPWKP